MTALDVVGFGALNLDRLFKVNQLVGRDEESFVIASREVCGGSAANTIVGLARLGLKTGFLGKVASDREGRLLLEGFNREKVDTVGVTVAETGCSGVVMGFVDKEGERALYVSPGVNDTIDFRETHLDYVRQSTFLHLSSFVGQQSFETQKKLIACLPTSVKVTVDPGMIYSEKGLTALSPITQGSFAVFLNEAELRLLTGANFEDGARQLLSEGAEIVGVKLGSRGCYVTDGETSHLLEPFQGKVVDTTGAGDAWNAGFLYGLVRNLNLRQCGLIGNFIGSRCIAKIGARAGLPSLGDLRQSGLLA